MLTNDFRLELCHKLFRHGRSIALSNTWTFTTFTALWLDRRCYTLTHYKVRYAVMPVLRFVVDLLCNFFLQLQRRGNQGGIGWAASNAPNYPNLYILRRHS